MKYAQTAEIAAQFSYVGLWGKRTSIIQRGRQADMLKTLKVSTSELDIGMYVSALDRPWLETPFFTQGFVIESDQDIARLREFCNFVFVDSLKSRELADVVRERRLRPNKPQSQTVKRPAGAESKRPKDRPRVPIERIFTGRTIQSYQDQAPWAQEHATAAAAVDVLRHDIDDIFSGVNDGGKLDFIKLRKSVDPVVDSISRNPDACLWITRLKQHDQYTYQHSLGSSILAVSLGRQLGLSRHDLRSLAMGCMLMDVGKLRLPPELLQANRELSDQEVAEVAGHVGHGLEILDECGVINQDVIDIVANHHERFDGSGYPAALIGDKIPPFACIAGIVDTYDAVTSQRSYAEPMSPSEAIKLLYGARDTEFQAELVEAFIQAVGIYPAGTLVELSSGEVGVVVAEYRTRRLRPKVLLLLDSRKKALPRSRLIDLQDDSDSSRGTMLSIKKSLEPDAYGIDLSDVPFDTVALD